MDLRAIYPPRPAEGRKGDFGHVLVAGGSDRYAGALAFNALAALRAGADLATVVAPRRAADVVAGYAPDLITIACASPFPDPGIVRDAGKRADALVVGGGVERTPVGHAALLRILREWEKPVVVDAEALRALAADPRALSGKSAILTPHGGEFEALSGMAWPSAQAARERAAQGLAAKLGAVVVVKGARDVIADAERVATDEAGSAYLTKGGYGDLLAGVAGALLARHVPPFEAARAAAYLVGTAGALAAADLGESTLASDALARLPEVLRGLHA